MGRESVSGPKRPTGTSAADGEAGPASTALVDEPIEFPLIGPTQQFKTLVASARDDRAAGQLRDPTKRQPVMRTTNRWWLGVMARSPLMTVVRSRTGTACDRQGARKGRGSQKRGPDERQSAGSARHLDDRWQSKRPIVGSCHRGEGIAACGSLVRRHDDDPVCF